jgi:hypothetical protein
VPIVAPVASTVTTNTTAPVLAGVGAEKPVEAHCEYVDGANTSSCWTLEFVNPASPRGVEQPESAIRDGSSGTSSSPPEPAV